jgi:hypothetical protein
MRPHSTTGRDHCRLKAGHGPMTDGLRARYVEEAPDGYVPIVDAMRILHVSRQTVLQRVKRGELQSLHVSRGERKGLRIKVLDDQLPLFEGTP